VNYVILIALYQVAVNNWKQKSDQAWTRGIGSIYDPFDPSLIHDALAEPDRFKSVVFGWDTMGEGAPCSDAISQLFIGVDGKFGPEVMT